MTVEMLAGDCLKVLPTLSENSVDSCVTDPPYHLTSIVKRFSNMGPNDKKLTMGRINPYQRTAVGFMQKAWDGGDIAFRPDVWREVWRVLKPGAHLLAFGGTRTYHRMACAIEDAGFEIRDCIMWVYGSGFPKSHDVSKGIDRAAGAEREVTRTATRNGNAERRGEGEQGATYGDVWGGFTTTSRPATAAARQWAGYGTALKPACEPIVLARKPLSEGTVASNVLKWGVGAINIGACRVSVSATGRWPANLVHDGSEEVLAGFPESDGQLAAVTGREPSSKTNGVYGQFNGRPATEPRGDSGSAARYFYTAKADADDRLGSRHPTVKPLDLMQYLVRLVTPKGGLVLDPFAGTGTTGEAAFREGMNAVLIEREAEYQADIERRITMFMAGPDERAREAIKERMKDKPRDDGPLFA